MDKPSLYARSQELQHETAVKSAALTLHRYYDSCVADAASAVMASSPESQDEALEIQGAICYQVMVPLVGGGAVLCGLASERSQRSAADYGIPSGDGYIDFKALATRMFVDGVRHEIEMRLQEEGQQSAMDDLAAQAVRA